MIEIAFDKNINSLFQGQEFPLLDVPELCVKPFDAYIQYAKDVLEHHKQEKYLIVISNEERFSANKLALAFFICSCFDDINKVDCLVIKNANYNEAFDRYKPYVAISIGIKYALRLIKEPTDAIYKELECLNYLNFSIIRNYVEDSIRYIPRHPINSSVETDNVFDAITYSALYKILALAKIDVPFDVNIHITKENENPDAKMLIKAILQKISSYIEI